MKIFGWGILFSKYCFVTIFLDVFLNEVMGSSRTVEEGR